MNDKLKKSDSAPEEKTTAKQDISSLGSYIHDKYGFAAWLAPGWIATIAIYFKLMSSPLAFLVDQTNELKFVIIIPLALAMWFVLAMLFWWLLDQVLKLVGKLSH